MRFRITTRWVATAATVVALGATAACGGGGGSGSSSAAGSGAAGKPTIRIGYFPDISPVSLMMSQKLVEKMGYKVTYTEFLKGVPQEAAAMVGGSIDMVWANASASVAAFSQDPGLAYLVGQSITNDNQFVVPAGSSITSVDQLEGKTITTSGLKTAPQLVVDLGMSADGKDPSKVKTIQAPGPQQVTTMQQKAVDGAATYLPFGAQMALNGGKVLLTADQALGAPFPGGGFVASKKFADAHSQAVVDVLKAAIQATDQLKKKTSAQFTALADFSKTTPEAIKYSFDHKLVAFADSMTPNTEGLTKVAQAEMKYGFVDQGNDLVGFLKTFVNTKFAQQAAG